MSGRNLSGAGLVNKAAMLLAFFFLFTGCMPDPPNTPSASGETAAIRLEYWTPFSGGDNQFMSDMVEQFNREHEHIQVVQVNSRLDDYYSRLRTAILSGNAPDAAIIHTTSLPQFVSNGYIEDITALAEKVGVDWSKFNPNILQSTTYENVHYAVPMDTHALVMYYNKPFLRMAGVLDAGDKPQIGEGPDGFKAFLAQIRQAVPGDVAAMAQPSTRIDSVWLWWSLYNQMEGGGRFFDDSGTQAAIFNDQALEALQFVHELYELQLIPPHVNDAFKLFYEGKAAVLITGMWGTGAFEQNDELDFGVVQVPTLYDHPAVWGDSHTMAIPTRHDMSDDRREAAMFFAKWLVDHGEMWAQAGHVPSLSEVVASSAFLRLNYRRDYAETADYVAYWPRNEKQWTLVEYLIREFEKMIYGYQTPEQALRAAQDQINAELAK